jgi:hypothetical protein
MKIKNKRLLSVALLLIPFLINSMWYIRLSSSYSIVGLFETDLLGTLAIVSTILLLPITTYKILKFK